MAMKQLFTNNAVSLLATGIGASDTTLTVLPGHGAQFPTPQENEFFTVTLEDQSASIQEIVHVYERNGDTFTIQRGREGTEPRAWSASQGSDTLVDHRLTAETLYRLSNTFENPSFPGLTNFSEALNYLLQGSPTSGGQVIDAPLNSIVVNVSANNTMIETATAYKPGTTAVYVGGARQKRGIDFIEVTPTQLLLLFAVDSEHLENGQNIVVDYVVA